MKIWRSTYVLILSFAFTLMLVSGFFGLSLPNSQASIRSGAKLSNQQQDQPAASQIQTEAETRIRNENLPASADNQGLNRRVWQMPSKASVQLPSKRYGWTPENFEVTRRLARFELEKYHPSRRNEIGLARKVELTADETASKQIGRYTHNPDGSQLRFITLQSPGAVELRVHFSEFNLPEGEEIYVYGVGADSYVAGPYSGSGPRNPNKTQGQGKDAASADFWSDTIPGVAPQITVE